MDRMGKIFLYILGVPWLLCLMLLVFPLALGIYGLYRTEDAKVAFGWALFMSYGTLGWVWFVTRPAIGCLIDIGWLPA